MSGIFCNILRNKHTASRAPRYTDNIPITELGLQHYKPGRKGRNVFGVAEANSALHKVDI